MSDARTLSKRIGLSLVLFVVLVLVLGATKIVQSTWNHERAARTISHWASKSISGRGGPTKEAFTFERVEYAWWPALRSVFGGPPLRVDVWDVHIWDPDGREVLQATHVQTGLRLDRLVWAKLRGSLPFAHGDLELHFVDAVVDRVRCHLAPDAAGRNDLVAAFARRVNTADRSLERKPDRGGGMVITVDHATVLDGEFRVSYPSTKARFEDLRVEVRRLRYSSFASEKAPGRPAFTFEVTRVETRGGALDVEKLSFPVDRVLLTDFHATTPRSEDLVVHGSMHGLGATLRIGGALTNVYDRRQRGAKLDVEIEHGSRILARLPWHAFLSGDASATAHLSGTFAHLVIEGHGAGFVVRASDLEAKNAEAGYRYDDGTLALREVEAAFLDGKLRGEIQLEFARHRFTANVESAGIAPLTAKHHLPVAIFAYVTAAFPRLALAVSRKPELSSQLHFGPIDVTLYQRLHESLPTRAVVRGPLGK